MQGNDDSEGSQIWMYFLFCFIIQHLFFLCVYCKSFGNHDTHTIKAIIVLQPEVVQKVEQDLINIMSGGTAQDVDILSMTVFYYYGDVFHAVFKGWAFLLDILLAHVEVVEQEEDADDEEEPIQPSAKPSSSSKKGGIIMHEKSDSDDYD